MWGQGPGAGSRQPAQEAGVPETRRGCVQTGTHRCVYLCAQRKGHRPVRKEGCSYVKQYWLCPSPEFSGGWEGPAPLTDAAFESKSKESTCAGEALFRKMFVVQSKPARGH